MKKLAITGAGGFVGQRYILQHGADFDLHEISVTEGIPTKTDLRGFDAVLHLAGLAHQMQLTAPEKYFHANFYKTKQLADLAKAHGVAHFIFVSTIKAFGEHQQGLLREDSPCLPLNDAYGESKFKAEEYLRSIASENFVVSIIRPPLIYGPGVKGNLAKLVTLCDSVWPLPFKSLHNRRALIYLDNLIALITEIVHSKIGGLFLAGDSRPLSTEELVTLIRKNLGRPVNLFYVPLWGRKLISLLLPNLGKRLYSSLEMDITSSYQKIKFVPPHTIEEGIKSMVDFYNKNKKKKTSNK